MGHIGCSLNLNLYLLVNTELSTTAHSSLRVEHALYMKVEDELLLSYFFLKITT